MIPAALTYVDELVTEVAVEDLTPAQALGILRARGYTASAAALDEAVECIHRRDNFAFHCGDPYAFLGVDGPGRVGGDVWDLAVERAEQELAECLRVLAVRRLRAAS